MLEMIMFEGCTISNRIPFIEVASRKVLEKLNIQTSEAAFSCCPDPTGMKSYSNEAWLTLGARNLCLAEAEEKDIISLCNGCANTLRGVKTQLKHNVLLKDKVNAELAKIGKNFKGSVEVKHFVDVIKDKLDSVKGAISKPLNSLKIACHPGCHYMRPTEWMESDDPLRPKNLAEIVAITGATVVNYPELALCCGSAVTNAYYEHGMANLKRKLDSINKAGANAIVVNCPACFQQFDAKQRDLGKKYGKEYNIPVLYLTELLALAMGFSADEIGLKFHRISIKTVLEGLGL